MRKIIFALFSISIFISGEVLGTTPYFKLAQETALLEGKLLLVRFENNNKSNKLWNSPAIWKATERFIIVLLDYQSDSEILEKHSITSPSSLLFLDAFGNKIYTTRDDLTLRGLRQLLTSFPPNVAEFYTAYRIFQENKRNNLSVLYVAEVCQQYSFSSKGHGAKAFNRISESYFSKAKRLSKFQNDLLITDKIKILKLVNALYKGNTKKGIPQLEAMLTTEPSMDVRNVALVHFYLTLAYLSVGNEEKAKFYRNELRTNTGGKIYWRRLNRLMQVSFM